MNTTAIKLVIKVWHDEMPDNPCDGDDWKIHSFSRRHGNFTHPDDLGFDENGQPEKELQAKIDKGLAFPLSYYEHGQCLWSLQGGGPQCRWDSVSLAGLLVWEGDDDVHQDENVEERTKWATAFVEMFTQWCNGEVYGYTIEAFKVCGCCKQDVELSDEEAGLDLPSCGGYYPSDIEGMVCDMKDHIGEDWRDYEVSFKEQHGYGVADEVEKHWKEGK